MFQYFLIKNVPQQIFFENIFVENLNQKDPTQCCEKYAISRIRIPNLPRIRIHIRPDTLGYANCLIKFLTAEIDTRDPPVRIRGTP